MTTGSLTQDYRSPHVQLPERSRKAPSLKWKWSTEVEREVKNIMASSDSERELRDARGRDDAMRGVR
jgi:hypothetical protein